MYRGVEQWSARMAHNHQVAGSNPAPATKLKYLSVDRYFNLVMRCSNLNLRLFALAKIVAGRVVRRNKNVFTYFYKQTEERNKVER